MRELIWRKNTIKCHSNESASDCFVLLPLRFASLPLCCRSDCENELSGGGGSGNLRRTFMSWTKTANQNDNNISNASNSNQEKKKQKKKNIYYSLNELALSNFSAMEIVIHAASISLNRRIPIISFCVFFNFCGNYIQHRYFFIQVAKTFCWNNIFFGVFFPCRMLYNFAQPSVKCMATSRTCRLVLRSIYF